MAYLLPGDYNHQIHLSEFYKSNKRVLETYQKPLKLEQ